MEEAGEDEEQTEEGGSSAECGCEITKETDEDGVTWYLLDWDCAEIPGPKEGCKFADLVIADDEVTEPKVCDELTREAEDLGCDELTREAEDLGMYWGTGRIATWCPTSKCVTEPQASGYCEACEEKIELLKQKVRDAIGD
jgi:hypothetical protein